MDCWRELKCSFGYFLDIYSFIRDPSVYCNTWGLIESSKVSPAAKQDNGSDANELIMHSYFILHTIDIIYCAYQTSSEKCDYHKTVIMIAAHSDSVKLYGGPEIKDERVHKK